MFVFFQIQYYIPIESLDQFFTNFIIYAISTITFDYIFIINFCNSKYFTQIDYCLTFTYLLILLILIILVII